MIRILYIAITSIILTLGWGLEAQASSLDILYSANTYGVFAPCPS